MKPLFVILISLISFNLFAQRGFIAFKNTEDIEVSYRWKKQSVFKKDSPQQLVLSVRNLTSESIKVNFTVNYYWQSVVNAESEAVELCVKPGKTKKGARAGLVFSTGELSNTQIRSEDFSFDIPDLVVTKTAGCN